MSDVRAVQLAAQAGGLFTLPASSTVGELRDVIHVITGVGVVVGEVVIRDNRIAYAELLGRVFPFHKHGSRPYDTERDALIASLTVFREAHHARITTRR